MKKDVSMSIYYPLQFLVSPLQAELLYDFFRLMKLEGAAAPPLDSATRRCLRGLVPDPKEPALAALQRVFACCQQRWPEEIEGQKSVALELCDVRAMLSEFDRYLRAKRGRPTRRPFRPP